jgi:hypothetical protein
MMIVSFFLTSYVAPSESCIPDYDVSLYYLLGTCFICVDLRWSSESVSNNNLK